MALGIRYQVARQIAEHAAAESPAEACGLLAGDGATITRALPLENISALPESRFAVDPAAQLRALKAIDLASLSWMGVYHSHPSTAALPSSADIDAARDHSLLQLIVSLADAKPKFKLWRVAEEGVEAVDLVFETQARRQETRLTTKDNLLIVGIGIASALLMLAVSVSLLPPPPTP